MKIIELRLQNLNSIYGDWFIDFTAPDYVTNGIFAITGPTGAGKSTIMDAICLALYGATPRLGRITASDNQIMSRQTGECLAEVTFESQAGRFRCVWSQHRARKKPDGKLAEPRHEISDAVNGLVIEAQRRNVLRVIEEKTGMDFDRFTRSILLAQGGFASFLQAAPDERAPVLEQITGTEIYSEISRRVHEKSRSERELLGRLQAEITGITFLSDEETAKLQNDLVNLSSEEKKLSEQLLTIRAAIQWQAAIDGLRQEIAGLEQDQEAIHEQFNEFQADRERLRIARLAADLEGEFANLAAQRQQQENDWKALQECTSQLPKILESLMTLEAQQTAAQDDLLAAKLELQQAAPLLIKVRALDQQIKNQQQMLNNSRADLSRQSSEIESKREDYNQSLTAHHTIENDLANIQNYLSENCRDEVLVSELTGITSLIRQLNTSRHEVQDRTADLSAVQETDRQAVLQIETLQLQYQEQQNQLTRFQLGLHELRQELDKQLGGRLLREYRRDYEMLLREQAFIRKIYDLEEERKKLIDGQACPLCGSTGHPYAAGNVPELDVHEQAILRLNSLINKAEQLEADIKSIEVKEKQLAETLRAKESLLSEARFRHQATLNEISRLSIALQDSQQREQLYNSQLLTALKPLGYDDLARYNLPEIHAELQKRQQHWLQNQAAKIDLQQKRQAASAETGRLLAIINTIEAAKQQQKSIADQQEIQLLGYQAERAAIFGDNLPDDFDRQLANRVAASEKADQQVRGFVAAAQSQANTIRTREAALREAIDKRQIELSLIENHFVVSLTHAGFNDENTFQSARLSTAERSSLSARADELDRQALAVSSRIKDRQNRLSIEEARQLTSEPLDQLQTEQTALDSSLRLSGEQSGAIKQKLADNQTAQSRFRDQQLLIEKQKTECQRWDKLHALIGSADGKKYRNFAQGLTFEMMVAHANRQLTSMTDRYLLVCDSEQPLELNVIDNYQAGEIRSTKNLSGGESFIVSLSLALGLSKMASRKVRVDSLFLDEGFGTLDEEALETALETLASLHQDGKLIGIISHVSALKERISTRIAILPKTGGKSVISGPGVTSD